jgi:hypothetical protein
MSSGNSYPLCNREKIIFKAGSLSDCFEDNEYGFLWLAAVDKEVGAVLFDICPVILHAQPRTCRHGHTAVGA